uniref:Desulfoferrodoxin ferrous iron-binding domain-containing protein n=1 Tax=Alexandrium monilatum TaxID=311494 RepID=A0A7S4QQ66_9DINO
MAQAILPQAAVHLRPAPSEQLAMARRPAQLLPALLAGLAILAALGSVGRCFAPSAAQAPQAQRHGIVRHAASERAAELSRKQALMTAAALAAGATRAQAEDLSAKVAALMKVDATPNDNGAPEKHLPKVTVSGSSVEVVVPHVMDAAKPHFIEYVWLKDAKSGEVFSAKAFQATDPSPPTLSASLPKGSSVVPMLFCNLHGLWEGEAFTV